MKRRKLTAKQKEFVRVYTDPNDKDTHLNATQSAAKIYNVSNMNVAGAIGNENLQKPNVIQAIEKKILKREELQAKQTNLVEKIEQSIYGDENKKLSVEDVPLINQLGINIERNAKLNGDLIDRVQSINVHIDRNKDLSTLSADELQQEVLKRMMSNSNDTQQ